MPIGTTSTTETQCDRELLLLITPPDHIEFEMSTNN